MADIKVFMGSNNGKLNEFNRFNGLQEFESLSQSSPDAGSIYYGTLESSGNINIADNGGDIKNMISNGEIDVSNPNIDIVINNNKLQSHRGYNGSYSDNEKLFKINLGNRLNDLDILKYEGYPYQNSNQNLANIFYDVVKNLRYTLLGKDEEISYDIFQDMLSEKYNENQTLYEFLENTIIDYPFIDENRTYREVIDWFCTIAQMQMFIDDDNNIKFVSARPRCFDSLDNALYIPPKNMFSDLEYDVILKNKYDGVEISKSVVVDKTDYNVVVATSEPIDTSRTVINMPTNLHYSLDFVYSDLDIQQKLVAIAMSGCVIANYYTEGDFTIPISNANNLEQIETVNEQLFNSESQAYFTLKCQKRKLNATTTVLPSHNKYNSSFSLNVSNVESLYTGYPAMNLEYTIKNYGATARSSIKAIDDSYISVTKDEENGVYNIHYKLLAGQDKFTLRGGLTSSGSYEDINDSIQMSTYSIDDNYRLIPVSVEISLYGNKRTISFSNQTMSSENIENAKTKVSINSNNLLQSDEIVNNIKTSIISDYEKGVSNATVLVSCSDYYNRLGEKTIDWKNGEVIKINNIVYFDNDLYLDGTQRYWKVKGRNFTYDGVPMVNLELEEIINHN